MASSNCVEKAERHIRAERAQAGKLLFSETPVALRASDWLGLKGLHGWDKRK